MKFYISKSNDPYFNMAFEEYFIKNCEESLFIIYQNASCVIIGKNQNPHTETGVDYLKDNNIKLVRRMSGGGAVYQDMGNLIYSFLLKDKVQDLFDFKKYSQPIIDVLNKYTTQEVYFSGRNDLLIDKKKISGSAQMANQGNLIHHGTLLYNTDFSNISKILIPNNDKLKTKGVKSVRSRVGNLINYLPKNIDIKFLKNDLVKSCSTLEEFVPSQDILNEIEKIAQAKRDSIKFILEHKKKYTNMSVEYIPGFGTIEIYSNIVEGKIKDFEIFGEYFFKNDLKEIKNKIIGIEYNQKVITQFIKNIENFSDYFHKLKKNKLIELIMGENFKSEI